jgi:SMI1-KNR4 cell-wall
MDTTPYPTTTESNSPTSRRAISEFERQYRVAFPRAYVGFLLATNGGRPENVVYPIEGLADNPLGDLHFFMGLAPRWEVFDLRRFLDMFADRIPTGVVPIAVNGGSDYVCLDLRSKGERVVFWDHAHFWSTGEWRESDLYFIAGSFEEFLKSLRPNPY